ncbi:IS982 family transposase [Acinetobacter larvae]|uniref:IS982 family transposase n=1 Tax=Acinetobacter larvae TaxID=1789224 RepID=A0A1B2M336_9GAMM|nr:IS982 family transposase [Acinetobacter larvae]AOA58138.1 IS982 family transposase [Acinetobacter larvae]AOA58167.1 IS982 family transposase [Acinetobacter larvae]AOA59607.1 IS982 family transposase [Acinetobacter larvae]
MDHITELFCKVDDFCKIFNESLEKALIPEQNKPVQKSALSLSEIMTIVILFHQSGFRFFKYFYCHMVIPFWKSAFPKLLSYNRFIEIMPRCLQALSSFFHQVKGTDTGISIIDSTKLVVCHNLRIKRNRVFKGLANRGKSSTGWFYGFKLHVVINNLGEIINIKVTSGNIHDIAVLESLTKELKGILLGDKGYLSKAKTEALAARGLKILTPSRKNMKNKPLRTEEEKQLLGRRGLIETVNDQLKNLHQLDHSRHRSVNNFMVNIMAAVVAYCLNPNKPTFKNMLKG